MLTINLVIFIDIFIDTVNNTWNRRLKYMTGKTNLKEMKEAIH